MEFECWNGDGGDWVSGGASMVSHASSMESANSLQ